jgi:hypothetical protein
VGEERIAIRGSFPTQRSIQAAGINGEQQHRFGIDIKPQKGGLHLIGPAGMEKTHLLEGTAPGRTAVFAAGLSHAPFIGQGQVINPLG